MHSTPAYVVTIVPHSGTHADHASGLAWGSCPITVVLTPSGAVFGAWEQGVHSCVPVASTDDDSTTGTAFGPIGTAMSAVSPSATGLVSLQAV